MPTSADSAPRAVGAVTENFWNLPNAITLLRIGLTPLLLRPLRLKKRSKSQPFGALTETRNGRSSFGKAAFFFAFCTGGIDLRPRPV